LLRIGWIDVAVCFEQLRAQRCQRSKIHSLAGMFDLPRIEYVIEYGSKATQLPERSYINFHVGTLWSAGRMDSVATLPSRRSEKPVEHWAAKTYQQLTAWLWGCIARRGRCRALGPAEIVHGAALNACYILV
jgi:hypothetical protein